MKRLREFARVVKLERPGPLAWWRILRGMFAVFPYWALGKEDDVREWKRRYAVCLTCPLYNKKTRQCRPYDGSPLGCGCYVPFANIVKEDCWGREEYGRPFGWGSNDNKQGAKRIR